MTGVPIYATVALALSEAALVLVAIGAVWWLLTWRNRK